MSKIISTVCASTIMLAGCGPHAEQAIITTPTVIDTKPVYDDQLDCWVLPTTATAVEVDYWRTHTGRHGEGNLCMDNTSAVDGH